MKNTRQTKILEIINSENIETQDELIERLSFAGYNVTQATISRDIKELGIIKISARDSGYRYALPQNAKSENRHISDKYRSILRETIIGVDCAMNMVVFNTYPGMANAAAAAIDGIGNESIIGTLAGDDTIFVVMRTEEMARDFTDNFRIALDI